MTNARESAARDSAAIGTGVPSRALMQRAGAAAAGEIARLFAEDLAHGVLVYAGPGNNGGDGWVVARCLAACGVQVHVVPVVEPTTEDARAERALAQPVIDGARPASARVIVDAVLGTGVGGAPRGAIAEAVRDIGRARAAGASVVALDLPTGVDADTGNADGAVHADVTLTFGTMKRGLLIARGNAGHILLLDIGLPPGDAATPSLVTPAWVRQAIPPIAADAHKGVRKKLVIVGGQFGMAGAAIFAARAAMRAGIGMVRVVVARECVAIVQSAAPHAIARAWPSERPDDLDDAIVRWADGVLIGPGLGDSPHSRALVERVLRAWRGPVVVDADGLNVFKGEAAKLGMLLAGRPALLTPHAMELARLYGANPQEVLVRRFDIAGELARVAHAAVLLKGVPTIIADAAGGRLVSAAGTPALAAAGSGDLLAGIAATLLPQLGDGLAAGAAAAWVHGRAAELASAGRGPRGVTLDHVEDAIGAVWPDVAGTPPPRYPVLCELPAIRS
ncbi:MAG TPA: NAD(P)H-hydrate dehydratase [Gemmatimonadaceae bacterium]|nr:NAD(P)H-hydrate dehydratase [Gemmatimonadaceae bacterium]